MLQIQPLFLKSKRVLSQVLRVVCGVLGILALLAVVLFFNAKTFLLGLVIASAGFFTGPIGMFFALLAAFLVSCFCARNSTKITQSVLKKALAEKKPMTVFGLANYARDFGIELSHCEILHNLGAVGAKHVGYSESKSEMNGLRLWSI